MPYDSNGIYTRLHNWEEDRENDIEIVSDRHDEEDDAFADALSECLLKDGRATMNGNLKMGGFQIKNLGAGSSQGDAVNKQQFDKLQAVVEGKPDFKVVDALPEVTEENIFYFVKEK